MTAKPLISWSYSRYAAYQLCPLKFRYQFIDKLVTTAPKSDALIRGDTIHKAATAYTLGAGPPKVPAELAKFSDHFKAARKRVKTKPETTLVEGTIALKRDWSSTVYNDWTGAWLRIKVDYAYLEGDAVYIDDYKTGKYRPDDQHGYMEQMDLYALGAMLHWPEAETVTPRLHYLDHGVSFPHKPNVYLATGLSGLKKTWEQRVKPMFADRTFAARPNPMCQWCEWGVSKGGECKYG